MTAMISPSTGLMSRLAEMMDVSVPTMDRTCGGERLRSRSLLSVDVYVASCNVTTFGGNGVDIFCNVILELRLFSCERRNGRPDGESGRGRQKVDEENREDGDRRLMNVFLKDQAYAYVDIQTAATELIYGDTKQQS